MQDKDIKSYIGGFKMKQKITIKITPAELTVLIDFNNTLDKNGIVKDLRRCRELKRIYNREVKKHNKVTALF